MERDGRLRAKRARPHCTTRETRNHRQKLTQYRCPRTPIPPPIAGYRESTPPHTLHSASFSSGNLFRFSIRVSRPHLSNFQYIQLIFLNRGTSFKSYINIKYIFFRNNVHQFHASLAKNIPFASVKRRARMQLSYFCREFRDFSGSRTQGDWAESDQSRLLRDIRRECLAIYVMCDLICMRGLRFRY